MRGAIFDLDGTLVDSMGLWETAVDRWLTDRGEAPLPGLRQTILRMSLAEAAAYLRDAYALRETADELVADMIRFMQRDYATRVELKPGVRAFLTRLRAAGVACCVATAGSRTLAEAALRVWSSAAISMSRMCTRRHCVCLTCRNPTSSCLRMRITRRRRQRMPASAWLVCTT